MGTTQEDIRGWIKRGQEQNATHLIVVCDTFEHDDYPVFVSDKENVREVYEEYNNKNTQRVMEVYNLKQDIEKQLNEIRANNF